VQALAQLNGIPNHHRIVAGQVLRIPEGTVMAAAAAYQPAHTTTTHTVQSGETLSAIALRYGVTSWALVRANIITNPALIFPGQILLIPETSATSSPSSSSADGAKQIVVDLSEQHLYAYEGATLVYSFVASTGMRSSPTRAGTFHVLDKIPNAYASTWGLQMPYWLGIYWSGGLENGIHALPILSNGQQLWAGYLGTPISYGCVVLGTQEARTLYEWADVGTSVVVQP
jgi:lipoprotein-anchoring transpeptidase ErfK/SrfK